MRVYLVYFFQSKLKRDKSPTPNFGCFSRQTRRSELISFSEQTTLSITNSKTHRPTNSSLLVQKKKKKKTNMGGKDDQEGNNDSGSDDDIAFADDDNDTKDEETNVESYDSDDENLEEVSFMLSIFLYRHLIG